MAAAHEGWSDDDLSDVRPYALTAGRTCPSHDLRLTTLLEIRSTDLSAKRGTEAEVILSLCADGALAVAEIAARMQQPVQIVKVLIGDLIDEGALAFSRSAAVAQAPNPDLLKALLHGLEALPV